MRPQSLGGGAISGWIPRQDHKRIRTPRILLDKSLTMTRLGLFLEDGGSLEVLLSHLAWQPSQNRTT